MPTLWQIPRYLAGVRAGLKERLTYANVAATLALAVAIGGGIAIAGDGNEPEDPHPVVARQAGFALDPDESKRLLKLPGIGTLTGQCTASDEGRIMFVNRSNDKLVLSSVGANHSTVDPRVRSQAVAPGEPSTFGVGDDFTSDRVSLYPQSAKKVTPQAEFSLEIRGCELVARAYTFKN